MFQTHDTIIVCLHHHTLLEFSISDTGAGKVRQVEFGDQCCFLEKAPTEARCSGRRLALNGKQPEGGNSRWQPGGNLVASWWAGELVWSLEGRKVENQVERRPGKKWLTYFPVKVPPVMKTLPEFRKLSFTSN